MYENVKSKMLHHSIQIVLRIEKYREKSVSQYKKGTFMILPPHSLHPIIHISRDKAKLSGQVLDS